MFCKVPWSHVSLTNKSKYRLCCKAKTPQQDDISSLEEWWNSNYMQSIRKDFINGKFPSDCEKCKIDEENGQLSFRKMFDHQVSLDKESFIRPNNYKSMDFSSTVSKMSPKSIELFLNNTCNFSCNMCSPASSSRVLSEWKQIDNKEFFPLEDVYHTKEQDIDYLMENDFDHIKVLGGEPFYNKKFLELLDKIENRESKTLEIITNGSILNKKILGNLQGFKRLNIQVSLDSIEENLELIRFGANWETIRTNIKSLQSLSNVWVSVACVISALNVPFLYKLYAWCIENELTVSNIFMSNPLHLLPKAVPYEVRKKASNNIKDLDFSKMSSDNENINMLYKQNEQNIQGIAKYLESIKFCDTTNKNILRYLEILGNHRQLPYLEKFSYLNNYEKRK